MKPIRNAFFVASMSIASSIAPAGATVLEPVTERELVKAAELIFQGVVTRVEYRTSEGRTEDDVRLPHAFVTYEIEEILKGSVQDDSRTGEPTAVTLRFLGGQDVERRRFLAIHGCPLFDVGERGVLFVAKNGEHVCPLVGWQQGRFRRIGEDEVFSDAGREVWLTPKQTLAYGDAHPLEEVLTHRGGTRRVRRMVRGVEEAEETTAPDAPSGRRLSANELNDLIASLVSTLHTPEELRNLPPVKSQNPDAPFSVAGVEPAPPPPDPAPPADPLRAPGEAVEAVERIVVERRIAPLEEE